MTEEVRFLTMAELCVKLRISDEAARRMLKAGTLVGIRTARRGAHGGEWRVVDPGPRFEEYLRSLEDRLTYVPLLSTREVAEVCGIKNFIYIHELVKKGKLKPEGRDGKRKVLLFSVATVRKFMWETQRLSRPRRYDVKIAQLVQWAKQRLEQPPGASSPAGPDPLEETIDRILKLPEPARSQSLLAIFRKLDKVQLMVQATRNS